MARVPWAKPKAKGPTKTLTPFATLTRGALGRAHDILESASSGAVAVSVETKCCFAFVGVRNAGGGGAGDGKPAVEVSVGRCTGGILKLLERDCVAPVGGCAWGELATLEHSAIGVRSAAQ